MMHPPYRDQLRQLASLIGVGHHELDVDGTAYAVHEQAGTGPVWRLALRGVTADADELAECLLVGQPATKGSPLPDGCGCQEPGSLSRHARARP